MSVSIAELEQGRFRAFGRLLMPPPDEVPEVAEAGAFDFFVLFRELAEGWQIGYLKQTGRIIRQLECHPNTPEVFVPLTGQAVLVLASAPVEEEKVTAFKLERPVVLNSGVWHGVISLSDSSEILIVENRDVADQFYRLRMPIDNHELSLATE